MFYNLYDGEEICLCLFQLNDHLLKVQKIHYNYRSNIFGKITKEGDKEISNLGESFRIFATCSLGEQNKLSEAVLSRFTVICSDKYKIEEQKDVLKSFLLDNKLDFNQDCINEIIQFKSQRDEMQEDYNKMLKGLEVHSFKYSE